ncbi:hypothetical protein [Tenacibaculum sp. 190524A02b]|uniref:hypothetical protein n=1 Tax=Tenacibaculum vairaonense TaxID=3137860 RepID=UPI0032B11191
MIKKITIAGALLLGTSAMQAQHVIETVRAIHIKADTDKAGGLEGISFYAAGQEMAEFNPSNNIMYKKTFFEKDIIAQGKSTFQQNVELRQGLFVDGISTIQGNLDVNAKFFAKEEVKSPKIQTLTVNTNIVNFAETTLNTETKDGEKFLTFRGGKTRFIGASFHEGSIHTNEYLQTRRGVFIENEGALVSRNLASNSDITFHPSNNGKVIFDTDADKKSYAFIEKGHLTAKGVTLDVGSFPDYVFAEDYNLMPLEEVASFIKKNKHLPNMPSEAEVVEKGMNVAQINTILVEKVEELTLHTIKQEEKINTLLKELQAIKKAISATKK